MVDSVILKNGISVKLRVTTGNDREALLKMYYSLSSEAVYRRFLRFVKDFNDVVGQAFSSNTICVVAKYDGEIVAEARLCIEGRDYGELAVVVRDDFQGKGLGGNLVKYLVNVLGRYGVKKFYARTTALNTPAIHIARKYRCKISYVSSGEILIEYVLPSCNA